MPSKLARSLQLGMSLVDRWIRWIFSSASGKILGVIFIVVHPVIFAVNTMEREFSCPVDGHKFKQRIETSGTQKDVRLDLRKTGDITEPPTLPQCPQCRFVLFSEKWSDELSAKLKPFVLGEDYRVMAVKNPSYFCLAQIQEFLRAPAIYSAHSYLRASWQVEENEVLSSRYLTLALEKFEAALSVMKPGDAEYANTVLLCAEIERRLRRWDAAQARLEAVMSRPEFSDKPHQAVIIRQMGWIRARDSSPRLASENAPEKTPLPVQEKLPEPQPISGGGR